MAHGSEDYWQVWASWSRALPEAERDGYKSKWVEPDDWKDFHSCIETGRLPGWFEERQQKIADAAIPSTPDEDVIEDCHRVLWLIRQHFKRVGADRPLPEESVAELYQGPDEMRWRLSSHATRGAMRLVRQAR